MRRRLNASDRWVRCQPLVSDSEASHFANQCEQVWREMLRKTAPRRYFTTGDIADYTGLSQGHISKTARDPNSWLALFVVRAEKGKHCRFVDPTGWLLELWCGFKRVKRSFPGATRNQVFKAFGIIDLEKGEPRPRFLTQREAAELEPEPEGIYRPVSAPKPKRVPRYLAAKGATLRERRVAHLLEITRSRFSRERHIARRNGGDKFPAK
jgi:hypothetical protein